ncbi:hypothetical protein GCM10010987_56410 [Bradyrhizobium guangdongense]|nr:hypothetical protein GCM10010987_56410 [Bradyrhizobium guangdongense]
MIFDGDGHFIKEIIAPHGDELPSGVSFSGNGKMLVSYSHNDQIVVWDVETGNSIGHPIKHLESSSLVGVRFINGDKSLLAVLNNGSIRVFNRNPDPSGRVVSYESKARDEFNLADMTRVMQLSDDESLLVTGSEHGAITIWQLGLAPLFTWLPANVHIGSVGFVDGASPLVCGEAGSLRCWDPIAGYFDVRSRPELGIPNSVEVHAARRLVSVSYSEKAVLITGLGREETRRVDLNDKPRWVDWSVDGYRLFVTLDDYKTIQILQIPADYQQAAVVSERKFGAPIRGVTPLAGGGLAVELLSSVVILSPAFEQQDQFDIPSSCNREWSSTRIVFSSDNTTAAMACQKLVVLEKHDGKWMVRFTHDLLNSVHALCFTRHGGLLVTGHESGDVHLIEAGSGNELKRIAFGHNVATVGCQDDILVVGSADGQFRYFSLPDAVPQGRSVLSPRGITTITHNGWVSRLGQDPAQVKGFAAGRELDEEALSGHLSSNLVAVALFYRSDRFVRFRTELIDAAKNAWTYVQALSFYEKLLYAMLVLYGLFASSIFVVWLIKPGMLCSLSLWLDDQPVIHNLEGAGKQTPEGRTS